jgi:hypothetical protein
MRCPFFIEHKPGDVEVMYFKTKWVGSRESRS